MYVGVKQLRGGGEFCMTLAAGTAKEVRTALTRHKNEGSDGRGNVVLIIKLS